MTRSFESYSWRVLRLEFYQQLLNFDGKIKLTMQEDSEEKSGGNVRSADHIRYGFKIFSGSNFAAPLSSERLRSIFRVPILDMAPALDRGDVSMWVVAAAAAHTGGVIIPFV